MPKWFGGLTVDQALPQIMVAERIPDEAERRKEIRKILNEVHRYSYSLGGEEERCSADGGW
jgi:hypothetical protein